MPIDAQTAVKNSFEYLKQVTPAAEFSHISLVRVEEVIKHPAGDWAVTLSYDVSGEFAFERKREYKNFEVNSSGDVLSMKIRTI
jgi:hypothetical protein